MYGIHFEGKSSEIIAKEAAASRRPMRFYFSVLLCVQASSGSSLASYQMGTWFLSPGGKAAGA
jgi:hypothetical protein